MCGQVKVTILGVTEKTILKWTHKKHFLIMFDVIESYFMVMKHVNFSILKWPHKKHFLIMFDVIEAYFMVMKHGSCLRSNHE